MKVVKYLAAVTLIVVFGCKNMQRAEFKHSAAFPVFSTEGHRGARGLSPENTIIGMRKAIDLGITTLEMDTHITKDGKVVVTHDDYLSPGFMLTPEGKEIAVEDAKKYPVYQMDYTLLRQFDLGTKPHQGFPQQEKVKSFIPLLAELIDDVQSYTKGKRQMFYNIETKCSEKGDGIVHPEPEEFVRLLMKVIEEKKITPYVVIQSFDKRTLQILQKKYPHVRTSYLVANKKSVAQNLEELGFNPFIYSPVHQMVNPELVKACHDRNIKVIPWTANTRQEIAALKALNVDGIITDYPNLLVD